MSREVKVNLPTLSGSYKTEFRVPIIVNPCQHVVLPDKKGFFHRETVFRSFHGRADGSTAAQWESEKKKAEGESK